MLIVLKMTRFLLVPEDFDLKNVKEVELPEKIYLHSEPSTKPLLRGRFLPTSVVKFTSNPSLGKKLLEFLKLNNFRYDEHDNLILDDKVYPISLKSSFLDLINEAPKTKDSSSFYKLLREKELDKKLVPKSKQKYFKYN